MFSTIYDQYGCTRPEAFEFFKTLERLNLPGWKAFPWDGHMNFRKFHYNYDPPTRMRRAWSKLKRLLYR